MTAQGDLGWRTGQQRRRRMARRVCGHCGQQVEEMLDWGGQTIAICSACRNRLGSGRALPESAYRWRQLQDQGPWCDVDGPRPCEDCAVSGTGCRTEAPAGGSDKGPGEEEPARAGFIDRLLRRPPR